MPGIFLAPSLKRGLCYPPLLSLLAVVCLSAPSPAGEPSASREYQEQVLPLLTRYCVDCHTGETAEAEVDLTQFTTVAEISAAPRMWQQIRVMLDTAQMPPPDALQPSAEEAELLRDWVRNYLAAEALRHAGDPGPVVLRRLNNAEYTYTIRDLTGVPTLTPADEFPVDGAAGEGFTNTGQSLVMSPALVTKYLDSAKQVAAHAMLLPTGIRFSESTSRSDWTNAKLAEIRGLYNLYVEPGGEETLQLQEVTVKKSDGGYIPLQRYLMATLTHREQFASDPGQLPRVAQEQQLSPKYLGLLWNMLHNTEMTSGDSVLFGQLRELWRQATPENVTELTQFIEQWQQALWRFTTVGHIGKVNGPSAWMEPVNPLVTEQTIRWPLPAATSGEDLVFYLAAGTAGDGNQGDLVVWQRPRLVTPDKREIPLEKLGALCDALAAQRAMYFNTAARCLEAAANYSVSTDPAEIPTLAERYEVSAEALGGWLDYLGLVQAGPAQRGPLLTQKITSASDYDFITGWVGSDALGVLANSSEQAVRIPGNMPPRSVAVHPAPTEVVAVAWQSPAELELSLAGSVQHAHPECGNGVAWTVELRRGSARQQLATGVSHGGGVVPFGPIDRLTVRPGDLVTLLIHPRDGNHSCDLSVVHLNIRSAEQTWDLAADVCDEILASNPHPDGQGNPDIWHFFHEAVEHATAPTVPAGSLLALWQTTSDGQDRQQLAEQLQTLLLNGPDRLPAEDPNRLLYTQLTSTSGPLLSSVLRQLDEPTDDVPVSSSPYGIHGAQFGQLPEGVVSAGNFSPTTENLYLAAPAVVEVRIPAALAHDAELVSEVRLVPEIQALGSVQIFVQTTPPAALESLLPTNTSQVTANATWTDNNRQLTYGTPILVAANSPAQQRIEASLLAFRELFPAALCYLQIVPVDEVVTLTLFHREDEPLCRLMLTEEQIRELDRHWDELRFISREAFALSDAFAQILEYSTQDADPSAFAPLHEPIRRKAAELAQRQVELEPVHLEATLHFAGEAYRRPLTSVEEGELRQLYHAIRQEEFGHEDAIRLLISRVLVSPAFLYRAETPAAGQQQGPVTDSELANRLSYFLWSSQPDAELRRVTESGQLRQGNNLSRQARRLLQDEKIRRLATEFACQWLHVYEFDLLDEKSERHFPSFINVRGPMYEEAILFFTDLFQNDGSVLSLLDADHTFLNETLAQHYGVPNVTGEQWRRVEGVSQHGRGGILALGATLSKQSGASRTSPILRGAWLSEVLLGEHLPRPPKDVPILADAPPEGLTERQLTELHAKDASCAKCHARIDPFGFALEGFDAIGRNRQQDPDINTRATLPDGEQIEGISGLRDYLLTTRREAFIQQFCRKLLGYSLGRSVQLSDEPLLAEMVARLAADDYRFSAAVDCIINSPQFQEIRGRDFVDESL